MAQALRLMEKADRGGLYIKGSLATNSDFAAFFTFLGAIGCKIEETDYDIIQQETTYKVSWYHRFNGENHCA